MAPKGQCKAFSECENPPGPDGHCDVHRPGQKRARVTLDGLNHRRMKNGDPPVGRGLDGRIVGQEEVFGANATFRSANNDLGT